MSLRIESSPQFFIQKREKTYGVVLLKNVELLGRITRPATHCGVVNLSPRVVIVARPHATLAHNTHRRPGLDAQYLIVVLPLYTNNACI
jgi:hypothetical protein